MAELKGAIVGLLQSVDGGLTNVQIGRALGIYGGHVGHEGHISRTLLEDLKSEGVVSQDTETKQWRLAWRERGQ